MHGVSAAESFERFDYEFEELRRQIWNAANVMRSAGLNPLETVEHVSLMMLLRMAEEADDGALSDLRRLSPTLEGATLFEEITSRESPARFFNEQFYPELRRSLDQALPSSPLRVVLDGFTPRIVDDRVFVHALAIIEEMSVDVSRVDVNGAVYEKLVGTISDAGFLGQYFTPRHIVDAMVQIVRPRPGESVYDPAAGTGGFLIRAANEELSGDSEQTPVVLGRELNASARRLCVINLIIHGLDPSGIEAGDSLTESNQVIDAYDVVLTNPPFGQKVTAPEVLSTFPVPARGAEALFIQHVVNALKPGGRAAIVCPEGLLANVGKMRELREWVMRLADVRMVLSLPGGVFLPYTGVRTGVLVLTKGEPTKKIWFFGAQSDGYSLDVKRAATGDSDLPACVAGFSSRLKTNRSLVVSRTDLANNGDRFVASRYLHGQKRRTAAYPLSRLTSIADLRRATVDPAAWGSDEVFYIALEHIVSGTGELVNVECVPAATLKSQKNRFYANDVLYGKLRPYLAKAALAPRDGVCSTELLVLSIDEEKADPSYVAHVLRSRVFTEEASMLMVGANHPRLHPKDLLGIEIPLPSLEQQGELMSDLAELQAKIDEAAQASKAMREDLARRVEALWLG